MRSFPDATAAAASAPRRELGSVVVFLTSTEEESPSRWGSLRLGTESLCFPGTNAPGTIFGVDFCLPEVVFKLRRPNEFLFSIENGDSGSKSPPPSLSTSSSRVKRSSWLLEPLIVELAELVAAPADKEAVVLRGVITCSVWRFLMVGVFDGSYFRDNLKQKWS